MCETKGIVRTLVDRFDAVRVRVRFNPMCM